MWLLPSGRFWSIIIGMSRCGSALAVLSALFFLSLAFLQTTSIAHAQGQQSESKSAAAQTANANAHPVLVELFTSEGCSSCPPADAFLQKLDIYQPIPGAQLIVLSEHVDYWDHDGWKDPNSSSSLTERQALYDRILGKDSPYTPQLIVDGASEVPANDAQRVEKALKSAVDTPKVSVRIGEMKIEAGNPSVLQTHVETDGNFDKHNADVFVVVALDHVESQVLHGENGGRHLTHVAVVQQLTRVGKVQKGKSFGQDIELKLKPGTDPKNVRVIAFVQETGQGRLLGAALRKPAS
jgi:hypothetical protein